MGPPKKTKAEQKRKAESPLSTPSPISQNSSVTPNSPHFAPIRNFAMEAQIADIASKLDVICGKLQKMDAIESKLEQVENALCELKHENTFVREELAAARSESAKKDAIIAGLTDQVNRLDQNSRANSICVIGLPVTPQTPQAEIEKIVFEQVVHPCLEQAKKTGDLPSIHAPFPGLLIDAAFAIPSKKNTSMPVIVKFANSSTRTLVFRHKKNALPQIKDPATSKIRSKFAIYEDLSPVNHGILQQFAKDTRVRSAWSYNGQVRFKIHNSETMYRVKSLSDTYESLVSSHSS